MERRHWWKKLKLLEGLEEGMGAGAIGKVEPGALYRQFVKYKSPGTGKRYGLGYKVRLLLQELLEKVAKVCLWTNNTTERLIGLALKFGSKTMRGFKKRENIKTLVQQAGL